MSKIKNFLFNGEKYLIKDNITLDTAAINAAKYQFKQINEAMIYPSEKVVSGMLKQHGWEEEKIKTILKEIEKHLS